MVSTWVLADDGLLRRDPVIRGSFLGVSYFVCFSESTMPQCVLQDSGVGDDRLRGLAKDIMDRLGVACLVGRPVQRGVRCFSDDPLSGPYFHSVAFDLDILRPLPRYLLTSASFVQPSGGDCVVYAFGKHWG